MFHLVSRIPENEMVMLAGDMNGHVGSTESCKTVVCVCVIAVDTV